MVQNSEWTARTARTTTAVALAGTLLLMSAGCKKAEPTVSDPAITTAVQSKIHSDSAISLEPVQVSTTDGTVTLTGQVSNAAARSLAANDAATVNGVQKVVNDLTVMPDAPPATAAVTTPQPTVRPEPVTRQHARVQQPAAPITRQEPTQSRPAPVQEAPPIQRAQAAPQPAAPSFRTVTVPAGSVLPVRITQTLDSASTQTGDSFSGALATDLVEDGLLVLPRGTSVSGTVVDAKDAGHFKGQSRLSIELTGINRRGQQISLSTDPVVREGAARGKNTAIKTGVGAVGGALLGGIFGGGKGAAIGSIAGGGTGAAINGVTRGQQVSIPSETVVRFSTTNSFTVRVPLNGSGTAAYGDSGPVLNRQ